MLFLVSKTNLVFIEDIITFNYSDNYQKSVMGPQDQALKNCKK